MEWKILKTAVDLALEHGQRRMKILLSGGEPVLEFDLVQKAVAYAERKLAANKQILFTLITNGTLLTEEVVSFLAQHSVITQISFDGVTAAQDWRARGTFASLDGLLDNVQSGHPEFYGHHVKISTTVIPQTVGCVADSVGYFLAKGVRRIAIAPSIADTSAWKPAGIEQFETQWARVCEMSLAHFSRTGEIPLLFLRPAGGQKLTSETVTLQATSGHHVCAAGRGEMLAIDVDGEAYPCITFAGSCHTITSLGLRESVEAMRLGSITGQRFWERYRRLREVARGTAIFAPKETRHSSYRACRDCEYFAQCAVCPVAIGYVPGNDNCERVPDFTCAFNFTALKCRERFWEKLQP